MTLQNGPQDTVADLMSAINSGKLEAAISLYEPDAVMVVEPGKIAMGLSAIREALAGFVSLKPNLGSQTVQLVESGDVALYCARWTLTGTAPDGQKVEMGGVSSDVLRRQPDGRWLILIDNPWGTDIVK